VSIPVSTRVVGNDLSTGVKFRTSHPYFIFRGIFKVD
jgi:hypothetical protein